MNSLRVHLPFRFDLSPSERKLIWCAALVALSILTLYVQLLHAWMARGDQMREAQRSFTSTKAAKVTATPIPAALARARDAADTANGGTR